MGSPHRRAVDRSQGSESWEQTRGPVREARRGHPGAVWLQGDHQQFNVVADTCHLVF